MIDYDAGSKFDRRLSAWLVLAFVLISTEAAMIGDVVVESFTGRPYWAKSGTEKYANGGPQTGPSR